MSLQVRAIHWLSLAASCTAMAACFVVTDVASAQIGGGTRVSAVGGISVDASGVLTNATIDEQQRGVEQRDRALTQVDGDLMRANDLRKISLRQLDGILAFHAQSGTPIPDEARYLAGLQRIRYVFVYPELNDIVLAGFGEGWKIDDRGYAVGVTTGQPVLLLDDLLVALRSADEAARGAITCSIDPTPEGLDRLRQYASKLRTIGNPTQTGANIERQLGPQIITISGVPATSHFARVMVAADFRMKRLAMNFETAPVTGLPSFLHMIEATGRGMQSMMPRWWLATNYDSLLRDPDGLAWELRGNGVKAMTEDDFLSTDGNRRHTGGANPVAQQWADNMTAKYAELATKDPIFGQLRACMDLAVVSALITKEGFPSRVGYEFPLLFDDERLAVEQFAAPKQTASKSSLLKKGRNWLISTSGGVQIDSWSIADRNEPSAEPAEARSQTAAAIPTDRWWWN